MKIFLICMAIAIVAFIITVISVFKLDVAFTKSSSTINTMHIISSAFDNSKEIPPQYTCNGENVNPPLSFSDIPQNTKSLVLIVDDPDAPMGTWVHWVVFNMPPSQTEIKEHSKPQGIEATTSFGKPGYGDPCPPSGTHHYHFKIYALDTTLSLDQHADKKAVENAMQHHILANGELIGLYNKK